MPTILLQLPCPHTLRGNSAPRIAPASRLDLRSRGICGLANHRFFEFYFSSTVQAAQSSSISGTGGRLIAPPPHAKKLSNLPFSHFPRGNSPAPTPHLTSQQLNHHHSTNHATQSKLTFLRRRPASPAPCPQPPSVTEQLRMPKCQLKQPRNQY